jgi:hypothetical protein
MSDQEILTSFGSAHQTDTVLKILNDDTVSQRTIVLLDPQHETTLSDFLDILK